MVQRSLLVALAALVAAGAAGCSDDSRRPAAGATAAGIASATSALQVVVTSPRDGARGVRPDATLFVTFEQDLDPASLFPGSVLLRDDQGTRDVTLGLAAPRVLSVAPTRPMAAQKPHVLQADIKPTGSYDATGQVLADAIMSARQQALTQPSGVVASVHEVVDMGLPVLEWSLARNGGRISRSGWVQALNAIGLTIGISWQMPDGWVEHELRFQGLRIGDAVIASAPGEPIHELGLQLKRDGRALGFQHVLPAGLANNYGSYWTTPTEYDYGGYEALASFFGRDNGLKLLDHARRQVGRLR